MNSQVAKFITHSNYIRAFATLVGTDVQQLARRIEQSGCLVNATKVTIDSQQVLSSLKNAWGTELLINMGKHFVHESELVKLSNNWSTVQVYYVLYHSTQAVAVAKGFKRPPSHPKTQHIFCDLWVNRDICLEPWTLGYGFNGIHNIPPDVTVDKDISTLVNFSPDFKWSLACKALKTTRRKKLPELIKKARTRKKIDRNKAIGKQNQDRVQKGKRPNKIPDSTPLLTPDEKLKVDENGAPTTIIDYFFRLRTTTNYIDSDMFTVGCYDPDAAIQVRDDLSIIACGTLLLAELAVSNIVGHDFFLRSIKDWVCTTNVPDNIASGIRDRLIIHNQM